MRRIDDLLDSFLGIRDMELGEKLYFLHLKYATKGLCLWNFISFQKVYNVFVQW